MPFSWEKRATFFNWFEACQSLQPVRDTKPRCEWTFKTTWWILQVLFLLLRGMGVWRDSIILLYSFPNFRRGANPSSLLTLKAPNKQKKWKFQMIKLTQYKAFIFTKYLLPAECILIHKCRNLSLRFDPAAQHCQMQ